MSIRKRTLMVWGVAVVLVAFLLGVLGLPNTARPAAAQADPAELYDQFVAAFNSGDVDGAVETFADDAVVGGMPGCVPVDCVGKDAIRNMVEFYVADHIRITTTSSEVSGNTATGSIEVEEDILRAGGVERFLGLISVEATGDKISEYRMTLDVTDPVTGQVVDYMAANSVTVELGPGRDGDQSPGTAVLMGLIGGGSTVHVTIAPGPPGVKQPIDIHEGTCADLGAVAVSLQDIGGGKSLNLIDMDIGDLQTGNYAINVQKSEDEPDLYVACGDIPAVEPAPAPVEPAPAPEVVIAPAPAIAPTTGSGGLLADEGSGVATWWYALAAGGAVLVMVGLAGLRKGRS